MVAMETDKLGVNNVEGVLGMQMFERQGRRIAPLVRHFVDARRRRGLASGLALIHADLGLGPSAGGRRLAANDCGDPTRRTVADEPLLTEVCDTGPRAGRNCSAVFGTGGRLRMPPCLGTTSRFLGQLATVTGPVEEAEGI
jgi:hypothetical protein